MSKADGDFELVAIIWPIADESTQLIQRVAARAYVMKKGDDNAISQVLTGLAATDFVMAKQYPIPRRFKMVTSCGDLVGTVSVQQFNQYLEAIVDPILNDLRSNRPSVVGISTRSAAFEATSPDVQFADNPYTVVTFLLEDPDGNLTPQLPET